MAMAMADLYNLDSHSPQSFSEFYSSCREICDEVLLKPYQDDCNQCHAISSSTQSNSSNEVQQSKPKIFILFSPEERTKLFSKFSGFQSVNSEPMHKFPVINLSKPLNEFESKKFEISSASTSQKTKRDQWGEFSSLGLKNRLCKPTGSFYAIKKENADLIESCELVRGKRIEGSVDIDNHTVFTSIERGNTENDKRLSINTQHKLNTNNLIALYYGDDFQGGVDFHVNSSHKFDLKSSLSTSFHADSHGDATLEFEMNQLMKTQKVTETLRTNLKTGDRIFRIKTKNGKENSIETINTFISNLKDEHSICFESTMPVSSNSKLFQSFSTDLRGGKKFNFRAENCIGKKSFLATTLSSDFDKTHHFGMEASRKMGKFTESNIRIRNNLFSNTTLTLSATHAHASNNSRFSCSVSHDSSGKKSISLHLKKQIGNDAEHFLSLRASTNSVKMKNMFCELHFPI